MKPIHLLTCAALLLAAGCASSPTATDVSGRALYVSPSAGTGAQAPCSNTNISRRWAVVVGVNFYQDSRIDDLQGAVPDAWNFYHYLASPNGGGVDPARLRLLLNQDATKANIEGAFGNFLAQACPQDQVFIYFAGHGSPEPGRPENSFLLVHDTSLDNMVGTAVSMQKLPEFLKWREQAGNLMMFIDSCHSGNLKFPGERERGVKMKDAERVTLFSASIEKVVEAAKGWGAISATAGHQFSYENQLGWKSCVFNTHKYTGGLFTCHLLGGLSGKADTNADGVINLGELKEHLRERVVGDSGGNQIPQLSGDLPLDSGLTALPSREIAIPEVPEKYLIEEYPRPIRPWLYAGAGVTGALTLAGVLFYTQEGRVTDDLNDGLEDGNRSAAESERDRWILAKNASLVTAGLVGTATLIGLAYDLFDEPQDIEDVYELPPRFEIDIGVAPVEGGGAMSLGFTFD